MSSIGPQKVPSSVWKIIAESKFFKKELDNATKNAIIKEESKTVLPQNNKKREEKKMDRNIKFRYIRKSKKSTQLIGCVAVNTSTGEIGWSYCTGELGDRFTKAQARGIAVDRLGKTMKSKIIPHKVIKEIESVKVWLSQKV